MVNYIYLSFNKKYIKVIIKALVVTIFVLAGLLIPSKNVYSKENNFQSILVLNSYDRTYSWTNSEVDGIIKTIKDSGKNINMYIEYMDWKKYPEDRNIELIKQLLKYKYSNKHLDAIITTDDAALDFYLKNRNELFGDVPVVFSGVYKDRSYDMIKEYENITGVVERINAKDTIKGALKISPQAKNIYLIHDNTESGIESLNEVKETLKELNAGLNLIDLDSISIYNIEDTLPQIDDNSIVLMSAYSRDINGNLINIEDMTKLLSEEIDRPIFQLYKMTLGYGTIGGNLLSGDNQGEAAADIAIRILSGEKASDIPVNEKLTTENIYDYNVMERFGIAESDLPEGSTVINKTQLFYEAYKKVIWIAISIIILLIFLVIILFINVIHRKKAENELIKNNYELSSLYEELAASEEELRTQYEQLEENKEIIQTNEERYRLIFETTNDGIWEINLLTGERFFSERWYDIFGFPKGKILNIDDWLSIIHPEDYDIAKNSIQDIIYGKKDEFSCSYRILTKCSEYKWIHSKGKAMKDSNDRAYKIVGSHSDIHEKKLQEEKIKKMAFFDTLTGLSNRTHFINRFNEVILEENNNALLFMDLDNFKNINDSFGHTIGDELLVEIAKRIKKCVKDSDIVGRLGGDEFLILITGEHKEKEVEEYLNSMLEELKSNIVINGINIITSASFGTAIYPKDGKTFEELFKNADTAMYKAKESGKRSFVFFEQWMNDDIVEMVVMEDQLRKALENDEFILYYQPKFKVFDSRIEGFEALIRWNSPTLGIISPFKFISIAEKTGLIIPIGEWVLKEACKFVDKLHKIGYSNINMAINVSVIQLIQKDFVSVVKNIIEESGVRPEYINIEITESILMESIETNINKINELKKLGVKISLDDFGKGYSSLTYLKDIPFDTLKIDKLFIDELCNDKGNNGIVGTIIELAHQMNLEVVAEGVENEEQYRYLVNNNCDFIQGYYISKPISEEKTYEFLKKYS